MRPPTSGIQASAAAMLDGSPVDCGAGLSTRGAVSDGVGGTGSGAGGREVGSEGSAMVLLDEIERLFVK